MSVRTQLRSSWGLIALNGIIPVKRMPLYLVNTLGAPFSFLFFIYVVSRGQLVGYGVAGGLVLTTFSIGTSLQADMTHFRVDLKLQDMVVASPMRAWTYVLGMALSELAFATPGIVAFLFVGYTTQAPGVLGLPIIVGTLLLVWGLGCSLGFFLATYLRDIRETFAISPLLSLVLSVLPPVYYPITVIPADLRILGYLAPTADASLLIQGALGIPTQGSVNWVWAAGILIAFTVAFILLAAFKAQWREK
ncbi:MAG TPA: ABC transporter permease [Thermoplasmata archaeon]|nr:ABC transporter permease [Thermoplasmata archaeon]